MYRALRSEAGEQFDFILDGDGALDLVVANQLSNTVSVRLGDGAGGFGAAPNFAAGLGPSSVAVGDVDGDGALDLAVASQLSNSGARLRPITSRR